MAPVSSAPVTLARLRALVHLHRSNVEGAGAELLALARERTAEVAMQLHFVPERLLDLCQRADALEVLVGAIDGVPRLVRSMKEKAQHEAASALAMRLAETARMTEGVVALDARLLGEILSLTPARIVTFGERGSLGVGKLRALLRETHKLRTRAVVVTHEHVVVTYEGLGCRGAVRLVLHPPMVDPEVLVVPLWRVTAPQAPPAAASDVIMLAPPVTIHSEVPLDPDVELPVDRTRPEPPVQRPFIRALLDAARDLFVSGVP